MKNRMIFAVLMAFLFGGLVGYGIGITTSKATAVTKVAKTADKILDKVK